MKVSLFITCLVDMFQSNVGKATVELLERLGCEVDFPEGQICCGQPAYNSGYVKDSKKAMRRMIETFESAEYVVSPSGSCAFMFKEYPHLFRDEPAWAEKAQRLADKTY
ncbi:(Fe-S)-binding protein, partial [Bacillus haynesii]